MDPLHADDEILDQFSGLIDDFRVSYKYLETEFDPPERMVAEPPESGSTESEFTSGTLLLYHFDSGIGDTVTDAATGIGEVSGTLSGPGWLPQCVGEEASKAGASR